ncbi:MAG: anthranilate synthase component I [Thermodesulfobacteriota bacterium]
MAKIYPSLKEFIEKSRVGNLIPVYKEVLADMETPVSAFKKIDDGKGLCFLFESVEGGEKWGRYSFLGFNPKMIVRSKGDVVEVIDVKGNIVKKEKAEDPLAVLKDILSCYRPVEIDDLPRFYGGAIGYIGYDMVRGFERLPDLHKKDLDVYESFFMITDTLLIFDNVRHMIKVVSNAYVEEDDTPEDSYRDAIDKIDFLIDRLRRCDVSELSDGTMPGEVKRQEGFSVSSNFRKKRFMDAVNKIKEYIRAGDIMQAVLSQRFEAPLDVEPFDIYRALRVINPSPYMFYLRLDGLELVGSSPEILVRVEDGEVDLRPIAGTRPRGRDEEEDNLLNDELLQDSKELAEHIMLVDLGRNDVGRVAETGSVRVSELMTVERYSHVMHIVSHVHGTLRKDKDYFDVVRACFPAGTLSGAPKIRAMEIIEELEPDRRGTYGGSIGYFGFSTNMDMCITIRTLLIKDGRIYIQAGAGIVADSNPEREYEETVNKAMAMFKAVEMARQGLD